MTHKIISVFGSARPQRDSADYEQAREVGRRLAEAGFAVQTGGYGGTMAAVSQGAAEAGGHVIGISCRQIERAYGSILNQWVDKEIMYDTLSDRLHHLVTQNEGAIAVPGGIGTLAEVALSWNLIQCGDISARPFVALGEMWRDTLTAFFDEQYVNPDHYALIDLVLTADEAVSAIIQHKLES